MLVLGCGYVGEKLAMACIKQGIQVMGATRSETRAVELQKLGIETIVVSSPDEFSDDILASFDAVVDSIPLTRSEPGSHASQCNWLPLLVPKLAHLKWAGYLSTTGVYGDAGGAWVDESTLCKPASERGSERLKAEKAWLDSGLPAEVFRLAGIYGPERNIASKLMAGGYKAVRWQPDHWSNRIHVDDIVAVLLAAIRSPRAGRIVNVADDEPLPHADYVSELAEMVGAPKPVILSPEQGEKELSSSMLDFFRDSKRISNRLMHDELLSELNYPSFRSAFGASHSRFDSLS